MKTFFFILAFIVYSIPSISFADVNSYCVEGSQYNAVNGTYIPNGTINTYESFKNTKNNGWYIAVRNDDTLAQTSDQEPPWDDPSPRYEYLYPDLSTYPLGDWNVDLDPLFIISLNACAGTTSGTNTCNPDSSQAFCVVELYTTGLIPKALLLVFFPALLVGLALRFMRNPHK